MATSQIITGQYVSISQTPASIGERIAAYIIDYVFLSFVYGVITYIFILTQILDLVERLGIEDYVLVLIVLFIMLPGLFYHPLCETFNRGQSLGKKIMKIQVKMLDGTTPSIGAYTMRWLFSLIDVSGIGVLFVLFTTNNQRMGDLAAGTVVLKINKTNNYSYLLTDTHFVTQGYKPTYPEAANLTLNQVELISRTYYTENKNRDELVRQLANKIINHLGIDPMGMDPYTFISVVSNDYHYYASTLDD